MVNSDSKVQTQSEPSPIPTLDQIKRLKSLQDVDPGIFSLAVFSTLEAYFREKLGNSIDNTTEFYELVNKYCDRYFFIVPSPVGYQLLRNIQNNQKNTNQVRHHFKNLSVEEANNAAFLLSQFANIFHLPNLTQINQLAANLKIWDSRKSPVETAKELEEANQDLKRLALSNTDMAQKIEELNSIKKELEVVSAKLRILEYDYERQFAKRRKNKQILQSQIEELDDEEDYINNISKKKNLEHISAKLRTLELDYELQITKISKTKNELQTKIEELSDAESYINNLFRLACYTRTRYYYEQSLFHLTPQQQAIIDQVDFSHDFLIKGSAGTGKSLVLLKTLEKLIQQNKQSFFNGETSIKLVTFEPTLEKYNKYIASFLNIENPLEEKIIGTSKDYVNKILRAAFPDIEPSSKGYSLLIWEKIDKENPLGPNIWRELDSFILPNFVTEKEYCEEKISRVGMKKIKNSDERKSIWDYIENIFTEWDKKNIQYTEYVCYKLIQKIENGEYKIPEKLKTDYLLVDDAQDLSATTLRLMRATVRKSMILTYDKEQAVFQPSCIWNRAGIDISRNLINLNINFRSTNQINEVAEKYRATIKGANKENLPKTFRLGPPVELHENKNQDDSFAQMISTVRMCINSLNYKPEDICIIASCYGDLSELSEKLKNELDLDSAYVYDSEFDFLDEGIIWLAGTQDCKGLDFPIVLFYLNDFVSFSQFGIKQFDNATIDKMNRNMIYTAITRSIEMLHVFTLSDSTAAPINDLKAILKTETK
jgi:hypothetical protein